MARKGLISIQMGLNSQIRGIFRAHGVRVGAVSEGKFYKRVEALLLRVPEGLRGSMAVLLRAW